jgi:hypothetical protein
MLGITNTRLVSLDSQLWDETRKLSVEDKELL